MSHKSPKTEWILEKNLDYKSIFPRTKMNRSSLIHWLLTAQAGSELNLIIMKLKQLINFKVRLSLFIYWLIISVWWIYVCFFLTTKILLRNDRFWRLDWKPIFKSHPWIRISNQFSRTILARIGSRLNKLLI